MTGHDQALEDLLRSPTIPASPAPAYTALPYRDVEFYLAPLLHNKVGDIELETVDGKRFLVHKKVLEQETVFFHIYYGFVPVWRLNGAQPQAQGSTPFGTQSREHITVSSNGSSASGGSLNSLLCLPKFLASHLRSSPPASNSTPPGFDEVPPPLPPKDVTAPTPTANPYTWAVPETAPVLEAFLSLIYPKGTFTPSPDHLLTNLELTARVARAALGYQASKALSTARDKMAYWIPTCPLDVYGMACFFKFTDLARLASVHAVAVPRTEWSEDTRALMGRSGAVKLEELQVKRLSGLREILVKPLERDEHSAACVRTGMIEELWKRKRDELEGSLTPQSELIELLNLDLRGGHCGDCLVLLGKTIQRCLYEAKELPSSV